MKLKAAATSTLSQALIDAMNSPEIVDKFYHIIARHLSVDPKDIGPATHYVQETDLTIPPGNGQQGINVALTMVSTNFYRASVDFFRALDAIQELYAALISTHVSKGVKVQLFCVLSLDGEITGPDGKSLRLLETRGLFFEGGA